MTYKTKAIVLKSKAWPRNARLYTLYSEKFGKIKGVAAGVQKIKSKVAGHLQPFTIVEVMMAKGRSIDRLAQGRFLKGYSSFGQDFSALIRGSYVLEIIDALTNEGIADFQIWQLIEELFEELHEQSLWGIGQFDHHQEAKFDLLVRLFALKLLDQFGFRPELYACLLCRKKLEEHDLFFSVSQSGMFCRSCRTDRYPHQEVPIEMVKLLRSSLSQSLPQLARLVVQPTIQVLAIRQIDQMVMTQIQKPLKLLPYLQSNPIYQNA